MSLQLLIVEDDLDLASTIMDYLSDQGMQMDYAANGLSGLNFLKSRRYDLVLLDVAMPKMNGLEMCQAIRNEGIDTPVLMLTARDTLDDKLAGFDAGTDDYVIKPFEFAELVARIKSLSKRRSGQSNQLKVADLILDLDRREASRSGTSLQLSPTGWKILETLIRYSPNVVSRQQLQDAVWGDDPPDSNSLKVHLHRLRQDIDKPFDSSLIVTVPNHGIALRDPNEA